MKQRLGKHNEQIQRLGRSLLLPIGIMAPVGLLLGVSGAFVQPYMIEKLPFLAAPAIHTALTSLRTIASVIFNNLPILFAMGVAYGMSKKDKGIAVFSSVVSYLVLIVTMNVWLTVTKDMADAEHISEMGQIVVLGIQTVNVNVFGGIVAGLASAWACDRFCNLELPVALAFFGGKKSVPVIASGIAIAIGLFLPFIWKALVAVLAGMSFLLLNKAGPFFNMAINRMLVPFGLHHVWNAMVRFTEVGGTYVINGQTYIGEMNAMNEILFNLGPSSEAWKILPQLTRFEAQNQMVITLFLFPAIGLAIYRTAKPENKKLVRGLMTTLVLTAMLGNVTEPLEFSFLFIAPLLFVIYACITGICAVALALMGTAVGYLRGTVFDFVIFGILYQNTRWINIVIVGSIAAVITYFVFTWYIRKFDVKTPGREDSPSQDNRLIREKRYPEIAALVVEGLGGKDNILNVDNCITRLRIDLADPKKVDRQVLEASGCSGVFFPAANHIHIVYGPLVEFVRNAVDEERRK